ncbi:uncharacterized protein LOC132926474 [Rhopalosiphum padi]|uniref:uncharacterized protein LOC132926474 n=1 Tax=Rhopalosiphum padi TaxID=40932 RepID=UPI00298E5896|nr:uncharacterized protein LOC132926474 [Rhopalosiphum padi]
MMSITKIFILFIAIVFIGEVVDMHPDIDRPDVPIKELPETQSLLKLADSDYTNFGMLSVLLRTRLNSLQTSSPIETTTVETESIASQHAGWRKRGQVKMRSEDGGFNSVVPNTSVKAPLNMNSSAINSTMSKTTRVNRIRRLASDNNTTESANPTPTNNEPKMSALKCLVSLAYPVSLPLQCTPFYFGFLFN